MKRKNVSIATLGIILLYLFFTLVNTGLQSKYGEIDNFMWIQRDENRIYFAEYSLPLFCIDTNIKLEREDNHIKITFLDKNIKIPVTIDFNYPLFREKFML